MNVETGITQLGDFLGQELHSLGRVAEDYRLINLELKNKAETKNSQNVILQKFK